MLKAAQMVRCAIESQYTGLCTIIENQEVKKANKSTGFQEVVVLKDQPCRLSYTTFKSGTDKDAAVSVAQTVKVFLSPDIVIKPGSKMTITQNGRTVDYMNSGQPAVYESHQEINLELFEEWA